MPAAPPIAPAQSTRDNLQFSATTQSKGDKSLNVLPDGTLRHRPLDGPLPPGASWSTGDACAAPWFDGDGRQHVGVIRSVTEDHCVVQFTDMATSVQQVGVRWRLGPDHPAHEVAVEACAHACYRLTYMLDMDWGAQHNLRKTWKYRGTPNTILWGGRARGNHRLPSLSQTTCDM